MPTELVPGFEGVTYYTFTEMNLMVLCAHIFVTQPLVEYWLHRWLHTMRSHAGARSAIEYHSSHHTQTKHSYNRYRGDANVWVLCAILGLMGYYIPMLFIVKYEAVHVLSHAWPHHYLYRHHRTHHQFPMYNYSFSAVWPDRVFGTHAPPRDPATDQCGRSTVLSRAGTTAAK